MSNVQQLKIRELDPDMIAPSTSRFNKPDQGGSKIVIIGKPGCFEPGTEILMYNGIIKKVEEVVVGDVIMGDDGTPRNVLELCHDFDEMYKIIPLKGESYTVNKKHDLVLMNLEDMSSSIIISVEEYLQKPESWKMMFKIYKSSGIEWEEKDVNISPYDFGLYIDTQVPFEYKINSRKNRLELLAGIIDSVGHLFDYNGRFVYEITSRDPAYINDIIFISRSLGLSSYQTLFGDDNYGCNIYVNNQILIPVRQKEIIKNVCKEENNLMTNFSVQHMGHGEYFGFKLDGNNLFLLKTFDVVKNTGKSTLITSLLYEKSHIFPTGIVMSGTEDSNHHYSKIFPSSFVFNKLEMEKLADFIKRQKLAKEHLPNPWSIVLLDDCTDDPKIFNDPLFQGMYKNGRHWKMLFVLSLQYCLDVKPVIRTNIDGTFILRESNLRNRRSLWENYAGVIPDFNMFCDIMDQLTNDYTALYIHNATQSNNLEDCIFWYRARPVPQDFRFGSDDFWKFHLARHNPNYTGPVY